MTKQTGTQNIFCRDYRYQGGEGGGAIEGTPELFEHHINILYRGGLATIVSLEGLGFRTADICIHIYLHYIYIILSN